MSPFNKTWLVSCLLLASALGACSDLVSVDRTKIPDELYDIPEPSMMDAGSGGGKGGVDAGDQEDAGSEDDAG